MATQRAIESRRCVAPIFSNYWRINSKIEVQVSHRCGRVGGGLLVHPDLFVQTDFHLFCLRYGLLSCTETPAFAVCCSADVQQSSASFSLLRRDCTSNYFPPVGNHRVNSHQIQSPKMRLSLLIFGTCFSSSQGQSA
jgi:hypothetical protein